MDEYNFKESLEATLQYAMLDVTNARTKRELRLICEELVHHITSTVRDCCSDRSCE